MIDIACFVGGGNRGVLEACQIAEAEEQLGKPFNQTVRFVTGTSAGALNAAAIAVGLTGEQIIGIYRDHAEDIFLHPSLDTALEFARGYANDPMNIRRVLVKAFGSKASWKMNDCPIKVLISAVDMSEHNWYFVPACPENSGKTGCALLVDAATASAAAPVYFDHYKIGDVRYWDGGIGGLANPTMQAAVEAFRFDSRFDPRTSKIITIGSGFYPATQQPPNGLLPVIQKTISTLVDTSEDWVDSVASWVMELQHGIKPIKLNVQLPRPVDMADTSAIPEMIVLGRAWAKQTNWKEIDA